MNEFSITVLCIQCEFLTVTKSEVAMQNFCTLLWNHDVPRKYELSHASAIANFADHWIFLPCLPLEQHDRKEIWFEDSRAQV